MKHNFSQDAYRPRLPPKKAKPKLIATWDTETDGLGGPLLFITYAVLNQKGDFIESGSFYFDGDKNKMLSALWEKMQEFNKHDWYAHNSNYDWRYLLPWLNEQFLVMDISMLTDSKILSVKCDGIELRDSYLLYPQSLAKFTAQFSPELQKHKDVIDFEKERFNPLNPKHKSYAIADAESLAKSLYNFNEMFKKIWGMYPNKTAPSSALKAWLSTLPYFIKPPVHYENFFRAGYYGGYVAPLTTELNENAKTYDINSSYPAAMREGIPSGVAYEIKGKSYNNEPGFYLCEIKTPDNLIVPVIPFRENYDINIELTEWPLPRLRSLYPAGTFNTVITNNEIEFARSIGYEINIIKGVVFEDYIFPFNAFVDKCETLRAEHKGTPLEIVVKLIQNALYGKFASKRDRRIIDLIPDDPIGWRPLELLPEYGIFLEHNDGMLTAPHIAAWITSNARLNLFKTIYAGGPEHVIYCDTDSLTVKDSFNHTVVDVGNKYGQYKLEKQWLKFRAHAPKVYAGLIDDKWKGACKGIPKPNNGDFEKIYNGDIVRKEYLSLNSCLAYFEKNLRAEAEKVFRTSTLAENCKGWKIKPFKRTELIIIEGK